MGTIAVSGACMLKAGAKFNESVFSGANGEQNWNQLILQAESFLACATRHDWSGAYATLSADAKYILEDVVASLAAIYAIQYDMSGYTTRTEAEDMINILRDGVLRNISLLRDKKTQDYIDGT